WSGVSSGRQNAIRGSPLTPASCISWGISGLALKNAWNPSSDSHSSNTAIVPPSALAKNRWWIGPCSLARALMLCHRPSSDMTSAMRLGSPSTCSIMNTLILVSRIGQRYIGSAFAVLPPSGSDRARLGDAAFVREDHRLDAVAQAELRQDALDVRLHGRLLDDERRRDLAVREAARDQAEHLALTRREVGHGAACDPRRRLAGQPLEDDPRHRRRQQRVAGGDRVDRGEQLLGARPLEQEAGRARAERAEDVVVLLERGQDHHLH